MKKTNEKKVHHSIAKIERDFFPELYRRWPEEKKLKTPGAFGSKLAEEFLEDIKREVTKNLEC